MGAMKSLLADTTINMYHISVDLNEASLCGNPDEMKQALRRAIVNSALAIAYLDELEQM
jgi:hypothetical protein